MNILHDLNNGPGYNTSISLTNVELETVRTFIKNHVITILKKQRVDNNVIDFLLKHGLTKYHVISKNIPHDSIWPKINRILSHDFVDYFRKTDFIKEIEKKLGSFDVTDEESIGREEFYFRLVRPESPTDVGPLHADEWFWSLGHGHIPEDKMRIKVWIPIHIEQGKSGFQFIPSSQRSDEYRYIGVEKHGFIKPQITTPQEILDSRVQIHSGDAGNAIIFHDKLIHGGKIGGRLTRVSLEFTTLVKK